MHTWLMLIDRFHKTLLVSTLHVTMLRKMTKLLILKAAHLVPSLALFTVYGTKFSYIADDVTVKHLRLFIFPASTCLDLYADVGLSGHISDRCQHEPQLTGFVSRLMQLERFN